MDFINIQRRLVGVVPKLQVAAKFAGRSSLLQGLPTVPLERSEGMAQLDLINIISGLHRLGRLTKNDGYGLSSSSWITRLAMSPRAAR